MVSVACGFVKVNIGVSDDPVSVLTHMLWATRPSCKNNSVSETLGDWGRSVLGDNLVPYIQIYYSGSIEKPTLTCLNMPAVT